MDAQVLVKETEAMTPAKSATAQEEQLLPMADDTVERGPPRTAPANETEQPALTMEQIIGAMVERHPEEVEAAIRRHQEEAAERRSREKAATLEQRVRAMVERHPDLVRSALALIPAPPAPPITSPTTLMDLPCCSESEADSPVISPPTDPVPVEASCVSETSTSSSICEAPVPSFPTAQTEPAARPITSSGPVIPRERFLSKYAVLDPREQRDWEKEAAAYMDGYDNGAEWVMEDRRRGTVLDFDIKTGCGHILEDETGQTVFVNRRAVKRLVEPRWRHNLHPSERVTFAKVAGVRGFWAAAVLRCKDPADIVVEEQGEARCPEGQMMASSGVWAEMVPAKPASVVGGSIYATGEAMVTISSKAASPVPQYACEGSQSREWVPLGAPGRIKEVTGPATPAPRSVLHPPAVPIVVNPYIHRGEAYSPIRGPAVRRPATTGIFRASQASPRLQR